MHYIAVNATDLSAEALTQYGIKRDGNALPKSRHPYIQSIPHHIYPSKIQDTHDFNLRNITPDSWVSRIQSTKKPIRIEDTHSSQHQNALTNPWVSSI